MYGDVHKKFNKRRQSDIFRNDHTEGATKPENHEHNAEISRKYNRRIAENNSNTTKGSSYITCIKNGRVITHRSSSSCSWTAEVTFLSNTLQVHVKASPQLYQFIKQYGTPGTIYPCSHTNLIIPCKNARFRQNAAMENLYCFPYLSWQATSNNLVEHHKGHVDA